MVAGKLVLPLFVVSAALLAYAHYRVWFEKTGHRTGRRILIANTVIVVLLWASRRPF